MDRRSGIRLRAVAGLALLTGWFLSSPARAEAADSAVHGRAELGGLVLEAHVEPLEDGGLTEGRLARFRFAVRDQATGRPLTGIFPAAWLDLDADAHEGPGDDGVDRGETCARRIEMLLAGGLLSRAELDLNVYYVVAMDDSPSLTVVDPLFGFGGSKLLARIPLRGPGEDWARVTGGRRLFVTVPETDAVAVVDTAAWQVETYVPTGPRPRQIVAAADGAGLWVTFDGRGDEPGGVSVLHPDHLTELARLHLGSAVEPRRVVLDGEGRFAYLTGGGIGGDGISGGRITVVDARRRQAVTTVELDAAPVDAAWSSAARALFVARGDGKINVVDESHAAVAEIDTGSSLSSIHASPDGRLVLALSHDAGLLHVVDPATRRLVQSGPVAERPDQIVFSDRLAYVRHRGSDQVLMIPLAEIGEPGRPIPAIDFPAGHGRPEDAGPAVTADAIVPAPGAAGVLVANPADEAIYFYAEGMAAPMGSFDNYGRRPKAVTVIDNTLRQHAPGIYETTARLRRPGRYRLAFFLDAPRTARCFDVEVAADPRLETRRRHGPLRLRATTPDGRFFARPGETVNITWDVLDPATGAPRPGLVDLELLAFLAPGTWQRRGLAHEVAPGRYAFEFTVPRTGLYYLHAAAPSAGLHIGQTGPVAYVSVTDGPVAMPARDLSANSSGALP